MTLALLWVAGCSGSPAPSESCIDAGDAKSDTSETGDSGDSGNSEDTGVCPVFGETALASSSAAGQAHPSDVTVCPTWSGIRDAAYTYSVNRGTGSAYNPGAVTTEFVVAKPRSDAEAGHYTEVSSAFVDGLHDDSPSSANAALRQTEREFVCDADGLWLTSEFSHNVGFLSSNDSPSSPLRSGWECTSQAALLLPKELTVGTVWSARCEGRWWRLGSVDAVDCTFDFTVDREADVATPGGTWTALHVVPAPTADPVCFGMGDAIDSYFTNPDGYWVTSGAGVIAKTTPDQGAFLRLSQDY